MKKWKSKLIAVVTALCMALSVPVFAGSASVYAATQTMTDSIQFNRMDGVLKKNSAAEKKALKFIREPGIRKEAFLIIIKQFFLEKQLSFTLPVQKKYCIATRLIK